MEVVIEAPVGKHSAKPKIFHELIEGYFPNLPKIELFARGKARPGWSIRGNEAALEGRTLMADPSLKTNISDLRHENAQVPRARRSAAGRPVPCRPGASADAVQTISGPAYTIDGDTISSGQHVRLNGVDAPEVAHPRHL